MKYPLHILAALVGLTACSADEIEPSTVTTEVESALTERIGAISAEYSPGELSATFNAQFVRVRGISADQALSALDVWRPDPELALDACTVKAQPIFESTDDVQVELLDAGPIAIGSDFGQVQIQPRRLPDVDRVAGVVYGNESGFDVAPVTLPYEPGAAYRLAASGGEVGNIDVTLVAPDVPRIMNALEADDRLRVQNDLHLMWNAQSDATASLFLAITAADGTVMSCRLEDDGDFTLPSSLLEPFKSTRGAELTLRRVTMKDTDVDGLDRVRIVFGARDSLFLFW
ncbi:MAG: hypothetical protein R3E66_14465 [bacterium]